MPTTTSGRSAAAVGAAIFGTLFADRLTDALADRIPAEVGAGLPDAEAITPQLVHSPAPGAARRAYIGAYADAMPRIFLYLVPVLVLGLLIAFFLKEKPLVSHNASVTEQEIAQSAQSVAPVPQARSPYAAGVAVCGTVQHPDGTVVPRAALTLIDVGGRQIGRGASGDDGRYALATPGSGTYVLIAAAGGHQPQAVSVTVGERPVELDVVLGGAGRLAGSVLTADGSPVRDATVTLTNVHGEVVATTRSGREGGYVITELVAGEYTLAGSAPPSARPRCPSPSRPPGRPARTSSWPVAPCCAAPCAPVADGPWRTRASHCSTRRAMWWTLLTTGPDGTFRFVDLSSGEYTVIAAGYPPVATVLQVAGGGRTERDLQLGHED